VVLADGRVLEMTRGLRKDNTGYDLKQMFLGAEGTLGIITAAVLKLFPKPRGNEVAWIGLESPEKALEFFNLALARAGSGLTAFELIQSIILDFTVRHIPDSTAPLATACSWYVLMQVSSGRSAEDARGLIEEILADGLERGLIVDAALAANLAQAATLWRLRETMPDSQKPEGASIKHDISVPVAAIPEFIERASKVVQQVVPGARVVCFGHMGDGNLHFNISQPVGANGEAFLGRYHDMNKAVHDVVRALSGSISAEHGIGTLKREELIATAPPLAIDLMRRVKQAFDPLGIMNPGKVI
jgi:FAD/FMN-containing dehydrogenase